jgi:hypothetical protein
MHSSQYPVPDPTRIIELPVHMRPTTVAPSPASRFARGSFREPATAVALLHRVYLQRDLTDAISVLQSGIGEMLTGRAVLVLFDANDRPWSPLADDLRAAIGVAGVEAIHSAATERRILMLEDGRGFVAPTMLARTAAIVAWRGPSAAPIEADLAPELGAVASRLGLLDHFIADHEANLRVAAEIKARTMPRPAVAEPTTSRRPGWPFLAIGALLSIALGLVISAALIQVPSYSRGRVVIRMPSTTIVAPTGGRVVERLVVANQRVRAGEALLRLDATTELQVLADADAAFRIAMGAYLSAPDDAAARAKLVNATTKLDVAKDRLAARSVYASIDGVVRSVRGDDVIDAGSHVATIVPDGGEPTAMAFLPSSDRERIEVGMTLQMSITGHDRIRVAVTEVEPSESFVRVKARLPGTHFESAGTSYELFDGNTGLGEIEVDTRSFLSVVLGGAE